MCEFASGRKFISESQTIIIEPEADVESTFAPLLLEMDKEFVIMVADRTLFSPYGFPDFVKAVGGTPGKFELSVEEETWFGRMLVKFLNWLENILSRR